MQPKSSSSGLFLFNKLVCFEFYINFIKFFIVNKYHEEVIQVPVCHCEKCWYFKAGEIKIILYSESLLKTSNYFQ